MSDVILELGLEHANITSVLDVLEDQLKRLQGGAPTDRGLVKLAIHYLRDFPEQCHHPKEDLVFGVLQKRNPDKVSDLFDLNQSHEELHELTKRISEEVAQEDWAPEFSVLLEEYLDIYRDHITSEERDFFPAALATLTRDDFTLLEYDLFDRKDHLFDEKAESRFSILRHKINELAGGASSAKKLEVKQSSADELALSRINSVKTFNELMREHDLHIVQYHSGGYSLERADHWLIDIPECDERRAAWCAYFYWRAMKNHRAHN